MPDEPPSVGGGSLRRNFLWTLTGSAIFAISQWAVLIVITKLGSTRAAGDWTLGLAITAPVFIFSQFKLRVVQTTDVRNEFRWPEYLALRLLGTGAALAVVVVVALLGYNSSVLWVILLTATAKAFDSFSDLIYGQEQRREHMAAIAKSQMARGMTSLVTSTAGFWWTRSVVAAVAATALSYGLWLLWDVVRLRQLLGDQPLWPRWHRLEVWTLFRRVLPLGFVTAIGSLQVNIPRYFLEAYASRVDLGIFGTISTLLMIGNIVVVALGHVVLPRMARDVANGNVDALRGRVTRLMGGGLLLGIAGVTLSALFGRTVLRILYSPEVAEHNDVLVWLAATSTLLWTYVFLGATLDAMRSFRIQPWIHTTSATLVTTAAYLLVPRYGLLGASWALLTGYASESIMYFVAVAVPLRRRRPSPA